MVCIELAFVGENARNDDFTYNRENFCDYGSISLMLFVRLTYRDMLMKWFGFWLIIFGLFTTLSAQDNSDDLNTQLNEIESFIASARGLPILTPTTRLFPTRDEAIAYITTSYESELSPEVATTETLFYRALGFVSPDFNLREFYSGFLSQQVAGYYDSQTKTMNTILLSGDELGDELPFLEQIIYAHEFTHALQDQHFDLSTLFVQTSENPDQSLALTAIIEGDATYMMQAFTFNLVQNNTGDIFALLDDSLSALGGSAMPLNTPPIFLAEVNFAYFEGMSFVSQIQLQGGWDGVNEVYLNLPASTEQILHPQKYHDGELPADVPMNDISAVLGDDWELAVNRIVGEFYLREYLKQFVSPREATTASAGWNGDKLMIYHQPQTDELAWVWGLAWDSSQENVEFADIYTQFLENAFPTWDFGQACNQIDDQAMCFVATSEMIVIASAPDIQTVSAMVEAIQVVTP